MCHQSHSVGFHHSHHHERLCSCGSEGNWRHFISKTEKEERLKRYKEELEAELVAVNELLKKNFNLNKDESR